MPRHTLYIIYKPAAVLNDHRAVRKLTTGKSRRSDRPHGQNLRDATPAKGCTQKGKKRRTINRPEFAADLNNFNIRHNK